MRPAPLLAALLLAGCGVPQGVALPECEGVGADHRLVIVRDGGVEPHPVPIECYRRIDERRLELWFELPAGPSCHLLDSIELDEGADAVAITVTAARDDDPLAGACPERPAPVRTELDLQAPVGTRQVLDGSREP